MTFGPRAFPSHFLSIYQSAAEEYERRLHGDSEHTKSLSTPSMVAEATRICDERAQGKLNTLEDRARGVSGSLATCAYLGYRYLEALVTGDQQTIKTIAEQAKTGTCDPEWITTLDEYYSFFGPNGSQGVVPYRRPADVGRATIRIKSNAKVAIVGDWGTGAPPAIRVIRQIARYKPDVVIHLGDIYYSGTPAECQANFSDIIDKELRTESRIPVFTLAGNHDMYSGGAGYYGLIDRLNDEHYKQRASFFCLRSEDDSWQLLGMDTGLHDVSPLSGHSTVTFLEPEEEQWHQARVAEFPGRTILLSHHQPFSAYSQIGSANDAGELCPYNPALMASLEKFGPGKVAAWFWGHEHNLSIYQPYRGLSHGRCLGHGAIPVFAVEVPYEMLSGAVASPKLVDKHPVRPMGGAFANGFAMLSLQPTARQIEVKYYSDFAGQTEPIAEETLPGGANAPITWLTGREGEFTSDRDNTLAFVIGNSRYLHVAPLPKAEADAQAVQRKLNDLGFAVFGGFNVDLARTEALFSDFAKRVKPGQTVLLYYSGHGIQVSGQNYIVPTDASLASLQRPSDAIRLQAMVDTILKAKPARCLVFLDACRDNPFSGSVAPPILGAKSLAESLPIQAVKFVSRGLTPIEIAQDTQSFVAFAAEPGKLAYEGIEGMYSRFSQAFLRHVDTEGLNLDGLMRRIGGDVKAATKGKQRPWSQANLTEDFFFRPPSWDPVWKMALLGVISGLITSWFVFNDKAQFDYIYPGVGVFFALVVGYGVWRWGKRSLWAAALATLAGTLFFEAGSFYLWWIESLTDRSSNVGLPFFKDSKLMRDVIGAAIAGPIVVFGCVVAGSLTTPALRRGHVYAMAAVVGVLVAIVFVVATKIQHSIPGVSHLFLDNVVNYTGAAIWQGALGACIGYGLSQYVPESTETVA